MLKKYYKLAIFLCVISIVSRAQIAATGKVVDAETQKGIADAIVRVMETEIQTTTNISGYFQLTVDTTKHLLIASPGYYAMEIKVTAPRFKVSLVKLPLPTNQLGVTDSLLLMHNLVKNLPYPLPARKKKIQHRVYTSFKIDTNGSIIELNVLNDVDNLFTESIHATFKKVPAFLTSQSVRSFVLPITYKLEGSSKKFGASGSDIQLPEGFKLLEELVLIAYGG